MKRNRFKEMFVRHVDANCFYPAWFVHVRHDYSTRRNVVALVGFNLILTLAWGLNVAWCELVKSESWIDRETRKRCQNLSAAMDWHEQKRMLAEYEAWKKENEHDENTKRTH